LFMDVCLAKGLPVFVIDPFVLKLLSQGNSSHDVVCLNENCSETCRYLCRYQEVTTFGVLGRLWKQQV
jgi:Fukutin N-terminal